MIIALGELAAWIIWPTVLVVCAAFSGMYSGLETGIYLLNKGRLELHAEAGVAPALFLQQMLAKPSRLLTVLLIGNNLVNYMASFSISAMFVLAGHEHNGAWYTLAVAAPMLFVIGECVPKISFHRLSERSVYRLVWLLRLSGLIFRVTGVEPLVVAISTGMMKLTGAGKIAPPLGHGGVASVVAEGQASGVLTHLQSIMADRVMHLGKVKIADVMIPMRRAVSVAPDTSRAQLIATIRSHSYSRLPVLDRAGSVCGILNVYDVLTAGPGESLEGKLAEPMVLDAELTVSDALYQMRRSRKAMAVVQRGGRHVGIVTIKDLVEEIVGELGDW